MDMALLVVGSVRLYVEFLGVQDHLFNYCEKEFEDNLVRDETWALCCEVV